MVSTRCGRHCTVTTAGIVHGWDCSYRVPAVPREVAARWPVDVQGELNRLREEVASWRRVAERLTEERDAARAEAARLREGLHALLNEGQPAAPGEDEDIGEEPRA